jgi:hypothetical protein
MEGRTKCVTRDFPEIAKIHNKLHFEVVNKHSSSGIWICDSLYETCVFSVIIRRQQR